MTMFADHPTNDSKAGDTALAEIDRPSASLEPALTALNFHSLDILGITQVFHNCTGKRLEAIGHGASDEALKSIAIRHLKEYHHEMYANYKEALM